jgi:mediator of RNA polymerase II transcription subunit 17
MRMRKNATNSLRIRIQNSQSLRFRFAFAFAFCEAVAFASHSHLKTNANLHPWIQPMSMSEQFTRATQRIDLFKELDGNEAEVKKEAEAASASKASEPKENPWEEVRKNIIDALTEVRVLHDVLAVLNHNTNAAPPANPQQPGQPPQKILQLASISGPASSSSEQLRAASVAAKKKSFLLASKVIKEGAERLERSDKQPDFHQELQVLRQHYRLRRKGEKILGDLSFRTAGSSYPALGEFEVMRDADCSRENCPLKIRLPHELQNMAWLSIKLVRCDKSDSLKIDPKDSQSTEEQTVSTYHHVISNKYKQTGYLEELRQAQHSLFTRELFR